MASPFYDTRTTSIYRKFTAEQYWQDLKTSKTSRAYSMSASRLAHYQIVTSYRSKGTPVRSPLHRLQRRRTWMLNPHPTTMTKSIIEVDSGGDVVCRFENGLTAATLRNGIGYGVASQYLPSVGYMQNLKRKELPISKAYVTALKKQDPMMLDLATNLGEVRETAAMIRKPLRSLTDLLRELLITARSRGYKRWGTWRNYLDALTGTWMEYRYGIMPLVYTSVDLLRVLEKNRWDGYLVTKGGHPPVIEELVTPLGATVGDFNVTFLRKQTWESKAVVTLLGSPNYNQLYSDALGLRVTNIPFVALELTRLSFVLEWFVDVSGYMRQYIPYENRMIHNTQVSIVHSLIEEFVDTGTYCLYQGSNKKFYGGGKVTRTYSNLERIVNPSIPVELHLGSGLSSVKRVLDATCLGMNPVLRLISKLRR